MEPAKVYFSDLRTDEVSTLERLRRLMKAAGFEQIDFKDKYVAIKLHFGEPGNMAYLRPNWARVVCDYVRELGGKPFLTDCNTLYVGGRANALDHLDSAMLNGYSPMTTGAQCIIADGLKELGLMQGDMEAAVACGAQALFMPHGLGHQMGLDVHDMENIGEKYVGYDDETLRSETPGLSSLRMGKRLAPGMVMTVEPGIYFIPALVEKWEKEGLGGGFINFAKVREYFGFGGIRIEDDMLITPEGNRMLGNRRAPATTNDIETFMHL